MSIFGRVILELINFLCIINLSKTEKSPKNPLTVAEFSSGRLRSVRCDSLSALGASLHATLLAICSIAPPNASLWFGKSNKLHPSDNNTLVINYLRDHSSEYAHSVFYGLSNTLFLQLKN